MSRRRTATMSKLIQLAGAQQQNALLVHRIEASRWLSMIESHEYEATYHCTHAPPSCTGTDEYLAVFQVNGVSGRRERDIDMNRCTGTSA